MDGPSVIQMAVAPTTPKADASKVTVVASVVEPPHVVATHANEEQVEKPIATAIVVERSDEGLIRRGGRFLGHFFRKVSKALRLY